MIEDSDAFDVRRALQLLSHTVRTHALRERDENAPAAAVNRDFVVLRCRWWR